MKETTKAQTPPVKEYDAPQQQQVTYIKIPVPNLNSRFAPLYVVLLMVIAFLAGSLTTKLQYNLFQKSGTTVLGANTQGGTPAAGAQGAQPSTAPVKMNVDNGHFPVIGDPNAKVTIVEFEDLRCPFCAQYEKNTFPQLKKDYIDTGKVKMYWRGYEFLGPASITAGNAVECANDQGKFWEMHDYLYTNQPSESDTSMYTTDKLTQIAGTLGMDTTQFQSCLSTTKFQKNVDQDIADAQKAGVNGTPSFFVNGYQLVGAQPYNAFQTLIDQQLSK